MTDTLDSLRLERDAWRRSCEEARAQLANNDQLIAEQVAQIRELERERDEARIMMERQAEEVCSEIEAATAHVERAEARAEKAERERDDLERDLKKERHDTDFLIENLKAAGARAGRGARRGRATNSGDAAHREGNCRSRTQVGRRWLDVTLARDDHG
jgi:chromosome segregation ATPase